MTISVCNSEQALTSQPLGVAFWCLVSKACGVMVSGPQTTACLLIRALRLYDVLWGYFPLHVILRKGHTCEYRPIRQPSILDIDFVAFIFNHPFNPQCQSTRRMISKKAGSTPAAKTLRAQMDNPVPGHLANHLNGAMSPSRSRSPQSQQMQA